MRQQSSQGCTGKGEKAPCPFFLHFGTRRVRVSCIMGHTVSVFPTFWGADGWRWVLPPTPPVTPQGGDAPVAATSPSGDTSGRVSAPHRHPQTPPEQKGWKETSPPPEWGKFRDFWGWPERPAASAGGVHPFPAEADPRCLPRLCTPGGGPRPPPRGTAPVINTQKMLGLCLGKHSRYVH